MSFRKLLFWTHLIAGCVAGIVILMMSVTGVLLTYERQIVAWSDSQFSKPAPPGAASLPMQELIAKVETAHPGSPSAITIRSDRSAPAEFAFGRDLNLFVDRYTGSILGEGSRSVRAFFQSVTAWHRWFAMEGESRATARAITGASNLLFLFLILTGLYIWLPRKWSRQSIRAITLFRRNVSGKARDFNWHNVTGIWCALALLPIVVSGVVMSYPWANNLVYSLTGTEAPAGGGGPGGGRPPRDSAPRKELAGVDLAWASAIAQTQDWKAITLRLPPSNRGALAFTIDAGNGGRPNLRSQLTVDGNTGAVVRWEPFASNNAGRRVRSWLRFLHTGEAAGIMGQTIAGIVSLGAALLVYTGIALALRRAGRTIQRWNSAESSVERAEMSAGSVSPRVSASPPQQ